MSASSHLHRQPTLGACFQLPSLRRFFAQDATSVGTVGFEKDVVRSLMEWPLTDRGNEQDTE